MLERAIKCFKNQTYENRELVVVYESDNTEAKRLLASLDDPAIVSHEVPISPKKTLGELRNISVEQSTGDYLAQWDDDDWHSPERITYQMMAIERTGQPACTLKNIIFFIPRMGEAHHYNYWFPGSLLCKKDIHPTYPHKPRQEDHDVLRCLIGQDLLTNVDNKIAAYVYIYHGNNTYEMGHFVGLVEYHCKRELSYSKIKKLIGWQ